MAFGTGNSFGANVKQFSFKVKTKDQPTPFFEVKAKNGDKWELLPETATRVSGNLIGLQHKENQFDGKTIKSVNLTLQDGNEVYFVSVGYTFMGRSLFNSLLSLKTFNGIELGLYKGKPKGDKEGFHSVSLRQNQEQVKWHFELKDLPAITKVKINGQMMSDTEAIDTFFIEHIKKLSQTVRSAAPVVHNEAAAPVPNESTDGAGGDNDQEPPF